jgi:hypothetical protein
MARAASPLTLAFCPERSRNTALSIVTGKTRRMLFVKLIAPAIAVEPKATFDKPVPINEYRFNTSVTPKSEEHRAISTPTIIAYRTNGNSK